MTYLLSHTVYVGSGSTSNSNGEGADISDTETSHTIHIVLSVDNTTQLQGHHRCRAALVSAGNEKVLAESGRPFCIALDVCTEWRNLSCTHGSHVRCGHDLAQPAERSDENGQISRVGSSAEIHARLLARVGRLDGDPATAEGLEHSKHDRRESVEGCHNDRDIWVLELLDENLTLSLVSGNNSLVLTREKRRGGIALLSVVDNGRAHSDQVLVGKGSESRAKGPHDAEGTGLTGIEKRTLLSSESGVSGKGTGIGEDGAGD